MPKPAKPKRRSILAPYKDPTPRNSDKNRDCNPTTMPNPDKITSRPSPDADSHSPSSILTASKQEVLSLLHEIRSQQCTKDDLKQYSDAINSRFKEVDKQLVKTKKQLEANTNNIDTMQCRLTAVEENAATARFENELAKQRLLRNNLSIAGVPRTADECLKTIASEIFNILGCESTESCIDSCYRINNNAECGIFIVKIKAYELKHRILTTKTDKNLSLNDIDPLCQSDQPIYINNHVTPFFGKLMAEGRRAVKEKKIHSCWMSSNGPLLKVVADGKQLLFHSSAHLESIISEGQKTMAAAPRTAKRKRHDAPGSSTGNAPKSRK